jgi:sugar/nucleoside kinase (ribokinase family)
MGNHTGAESVDYCVTLPDSAPEALRSHIGIAQDAPLRIAFAPGRAMRPGHLIIGHAGNLTHAFL